MYFKWILLTLIINAILMMTLIWKLHFHKKIDAIQKIRGVTQLGIQMWRFLPKILVTFLFINYGVYMYFIIKSNEYVILIAAFFYLCITGAAALIATIKPVRKKHFLKAKAVKKEPKISLRHLNMRKLFKTKAA